MTRPPEWNEWAGDEPDRDTWEHDGFPCLAVRHPRLGFWCGYVGVPPGHPAYGKDANVDVHGGLTFAGHGHEEWIGQPAPEGFWWLGFDCGHVFDLCPALVVNHRRKYAETGDPLWLEPDPVGERYRDLAYVKQECARLAEQIQHVS